MDSTGRQLEAVRTRLAPSPTGLLHLGHARSFALAWLAARSSPGGSVVLRIEDLDATRVRPGMTEAAIRDLRWLGLDWDEGPDTGGISAPYVQSERTSAYNQALDTLKSAERVYPCTRSNAELRRLASAPHEGEPLGLPEAPDTKRLSVEDAQRLVDTPFAWRFRSDGPGWLEWDDHLRGPQRHRLDALGGFSVARSEGTFAYQLAVVVDDAAMHITDVIRGDDLMESTPRQLLIYRALGLRPPRFAHVPLAVDGSGRRLSKRDGAITMAGLRERGADPGRIRSWIAHSCGWSDRWDFPSSWDDWQPALRQVGLPRETWIIRPEDLQTLTPEHHGKPTRS